MSIEPTLASIVLATGEGQHVEFLNNLTTIKLAGRDRTMSVVEFLAPRGFGPPEHRHNDEDELFVTFQVLSPTARFLNVTASQTGSPRFDEMVAALGTPTEATVIPEPSYIDPGRVAEVCASFGIDIVGPPPPPLPEAL